MSAGRLGELMSGEATCLTVLGGREADESFPLGSVAHFGVVCSVASQRRALRRREERSSGVRAE